MWLQRYAIAGSVLGLIALSSCVPVFAELTKDPVVSCGCECINGIPQTLCLSVQAAQQQTWACPPSYTCPVPNSTALEVELPLLDAAARAKRNPDGSLLPPHPQAENCRAVRVWHRQLQAYTGVNVCDVQMPAP